MKQTRSVDGIIWFNIKEWFQLHDIRDYIILMISQNTRLIHSIVWWHIPVTADDRLGKIPQNTLKIHGRVLWHRPVTTGYFIIKTGHCRRLYTRFTRLGKIPQNTLKIHGHVLWHRPVTTDYFINVPREYWGSGRPASVSVTPTPAVICPPSGLYLRLHLWSRSDLIQLLSEYQQDI